MTELKALIFDVDGTLAATEHAHLEAFNETFAAHGLNWNWSVALYTDLLAIAGGKERIQFFMNHYQPPVPAVENLANFAADLHKEKTQCYLNKVARGQVTLRPGVRRLLAEARQANLRLAIATTTHFSNVQMLLERCVAPAALTWFEVIVAGDNVLHKKPAPDAYQAALAQLKLSASDCLALEDSDNGLNSARGAGIRTLITVNEFTHTQNFAGAALVIDHLGEPDQPFTVLAGEPYGARWVNISLLKSISRHEPT